MEMSEKTRSYTFVWFLCGTNNAYIYIENRRPSIYDLCARTHERRRTRTRSINTRARISAWVNVLVDARWDPETHRRTRVQSRARKRSSTYARTTALKHTHKRVCARIRYARAHERTQTHAYACKRARADKRKHSMTSITIPRRCSPLDN